jgi:adenylate cyclase
LLTGEHPALRRHRHFNGLIPSNPRCSFCKAPFGGPGGTLARLRGRQPSRLNPNMCTACELVAEKHPGGVELEATVLFADVRGSTGLAETMRPADFRQLIDRFYSSASAALAESQALIEDLQGDQVTGIYLPAFAGEEYTRVAVEAAQEILRATGHDDGEGPWVPVGAGVHTGTTFVGAVGGHPTTQITALGDVPNIGARLASSAAAGEILVSEPAARAAKLPVEDLEHRLLQLKGRREPVGAYVLTAAARPQPQTALAGRA